jgi:putative heme-binding domain-containing protein
MHRDDENEDGKGALASWSAVPEASGPRLQATDDNADSFIREFWGSRGLSGPRSAPRGQIVSLVLAVTLGLSVARAAEEPAEQKLFLPKSPRAAAYILGRLTNKELIAAPRSEFVYVALLQRKGLDRKYRLEALAGLAQAHHTDPLTELIAGLSEVDKKGEEAQPVLRDLGGLLLQDKPADLTAKRDALAKLAQEAQVPLSRQIGYAALITADQSMERPWQRSESDASKRADLLLSLPLVRDPSLRASLYPKVEPLLHQADPSEVRRAAITAATALPGHDEETFRTLTALMMAGTERAAAVDSLQRIPRKAWPKEQAEMLIQNLIAYLQTVPVDQRTQPEVVSAFQFATDLASLLPADKASATSKKLRAIGVSVFIIRTVLEQMLYDKTLLVVEANKPMEIILRNEDSMPHNLVITAPGAVEEIGAAAEKMSLEPDGQGRLYVPASPKALHATKMVDPGQEARLAFTAPSVPGDYSYVCTFPGHWRRMVGTLAVVPDVEDYLANRASVAEPKVTEWKVDDLAADLAQANVGRNLANGKELFTKLSCAQCHKLGPEGNNYGPDLSDVFQRYKSDRRELLRQILEPSLVISNRYRNYQFELKNGDSAMGMVLQEDAQNVTIQTGPSEALIQTLKQSDIQERQPQSSSVMPLGLLNTLSKDQILDLLALLESGGRPHAHDH